MGAIADFPPGTHRVVQAGRVAVGVFNVDGTYLRAANICPHQFGPLCDGDGQWHDGLLRGDRLEVRLGPSG